MQSPGSRRCGAPAGKAVLVTGSRVAVSHRESPWIAVVCGTRGVHRTVRGLRLEPCQFRAGGVEVGFGSLGSDAQGGAGIFEGGEPGVGGGVKFVAFALGVGSDWAILRLPGPGRGRRAGWRRLRPAGLAWFPARPGVAGWWRRRPGVRRPRGPARCRAVRWLVHGRSRQRCRRGVGPRGPQSPG